MMQRRSLIRIDDSISHRLRVWSIFWANINPMFDSLRPEPRFRNLILKMTQATFPGSILKETPQHAV